MARCGPMVGGTRTSVQALVSTAEPSERRHLSNSASGVVRSVFAMSAKVDLQAAKSERDFARKSS